MDSYRRNQRWNDSPRQMSHRVIEDDDYTLFHVEDLADRLKRERRTELARQQAGNIFFIELHVVIVRSPFDIMSQNQYLQYIRFLYSYVLKII